MTDLFCSDEIRTNDVYREQRVHNIINNNNNNNSNNKNNIVIIIENELDKDSKEPKYLHKKFKKIASSSNTCQENGQDLDTLTLGNATISELDSGIFFDPSSGSESLNDLRKSGYICPYCKLSCAKPSVLQKHVRAHTNERPYPCMPCGFAFKTKSNLYKHCRSRTHVLKMEGADIMVCELLLLIRDVATYYIFHYVLSIGAT